MVKCATPRPSTVAKRSRGAAPVRPRSKSMRRSAASAAGSARRPPGRRSSHTRPTGLKIGCSKTSAGLADASVALTRLPSVRAPPAASSDDSVLIATAIPLGGGSEDEQVSGIGVDRNVHRRALEHVALGAGRDADDREGLAAVKPRRAPRRAFQRATPRWTAPLASSVWTILRLRSLWSLSTTAIGILRRIWFR